MKVFGIDPGSLICGYGLIQTRTEQPGSFQESPIRKRAFRGQGLSYLTSGRIVLPAKNPLSERLSVLHRSLQEVIDEFRPDEIVIEKMFFAKGIKAALSFGHTRGVVLLTAALSRVPIYEYTPLEVKKAVVGYGNADKNQVQAMVREILGISHTLSSDSADALALAICHANTNKYATAR